MLPKRLTHKFFKQAIHGTDAVFRKRAAFSTHVSHTLYDSFANPKLHKEKHLLSPISPLLHLRRSETISNIRVSIRGAEHTQKKSYIKLIIENAEAQALTSSALAKMSEI